MVNESIASLGGKDNAKNGWTALFTAHNDGNGYQTGQKIAIKANMNGSAVFDNDTSGETNMSYTNSVLLKTLLISLVEEADYVINLANLKGHSYGITLCGKNHFGSFINGNAMYPPQGANLHQWDCIL